MKKETTMSKPTTNPIFEVDFSKLMNPSKIMGEFKIPGFDMNVLMDIQRKNIEMITTINQTVVENLQSFAQRQTELMQRVLEDSSSMMNAMMSATTPQEKVVYQAEASKKVAEQCMTNVRDNAEAFAKCNSQAMETVSNRMSDNLVELRGMTKTNVAA
jgi:phasin family protein